MFKIDLTLNLELMSDCILTIHVFYGASVLSGIFSGNFTNKERSFWQQSDTFRSGVRCSFNFPLDFRKGSSDSLARQFDVFTVRDTESVVK